MPKTITPKEFRDLGYLQELNRIFLHPLGMALSIKICTHEAKNDKPAHLPEECDIPDGELNCIWDSRDDPEGYFFDPKDIQENLADYLLKQHNVDEAKYRFIPRRSMYIDDKSIPQEAWTCYYVQKIPKDVFEI